MIYTDTLFGKKLIGWTRKWIDMKPIDSSVADDIIERHHYSGKATTNRFASFGIKYAHPEIKYILSYADGSVGNKGIIYQAGNYKKVGELKVDFYILPSGERVHPVTMWHRHKSRAWGLLTSLYPGIKKAEGKQYRYLLKI